MNGYQVSLYLLAALAAVCSILVVVKKSPIAGSFNLLLVFFALAGIYAVMSAHLIAVMQVLIYAGAIVVLFVFVIMLLNADLPSLDIGKANRIFVAMAAVLTAVAIGLFVFAFRSAQFVVPQGKFSVEAIDAAGGNTQVISEVMFNQYLLPFEMTSLLLLATIVGTVAMAKRVDKAPPNAAEAGGRKQ